jgi:polyisoprenoid-binding protein YceI
MSTPQVQPHAHPDSVRARSVRRVVAALALTLALCVFAGIALAQDASDSGSASAERATTEDTRRRGNMTVLRDDSTLYAVTHRAGLFGFLGHEHAITVETWTVDLCYLEDIEDSYIEVTVPTDSVRLDTERGLELAGVESSPDPGTISGLQAQMLGADFLHADMFPQLRFASTAVSRQPDDAAQDAGSDAASVEDLRIEGDLTVHGRTTQIAFPVRVERADTGAFTFSAHVQFRMTDFGITPENTAGVVAVADEMDLYVDIAAQRTGNACE